MAGSIFTVNKSTLRPITIGGVEKRLAVLNALPSFLLVAATHFHFPAAFVGVSFYCVGHFLLARVTKLDPILATVFRRYTRYWAKPYYPARGAVMSFDALPIKSVSRPW